jgi:O-acetyl-ADP-ribose deacetylase (regulator of RNase III)
MVHYRKGDATEPQAPAPWILTHVVNDRGGWGAGFVLSISKRWLAPEIEYRAWHDANPDFRHIPFELGYTQMVKVGPDQYVASMLAQHGFRGGKAGIPLQYDALRKCLACVNLAAIQFEASVHMPRIGCGLAGGDWKTVSQIIKEELQGVEVYVYDL